MTYTARPSLFLPTDVSGCRLWLDAGDAATLYTSDAGPVTAVTAPTDISGCVGWWDASDANTLFAADTGSTLATTTVGRWANKGTLGAAADLLQSVSGNRPTITAAALNGRPVLTFNGTTNSLRSGAFTLNQPFQYYIVFRFESAYSSGTQMIIDAGTQPSPGRSGEVYRQDANTIGAFSGSVLGASVTSANIQSFGLYTFSFAGASSYIRYRAGDIQSAANAGTTNGSRLTVGGDSNNTAAALSNISTAEIICFNTALSAADRSRVEAYLAAKWGIANVHVPATTVGRAIGYWGDKSGNNNHFVQTLSSARPVRDTLNGRSVINFPSPAAAYFTSQTNFSSQFPTAATVFSAYRVAPNFGSYSVFETSGNYPWTYTTSTGAGHYGIFRSTRTNSVAGVTSPQLASPSGYLTAGNILRVQSTAGSYAVHRCGKLLYQDSNTADGVATYSAGSTAYSIGFTHSASGFVGQYLELLIYNSILSEENIKKIEAYLSDKWNIPLAARTAPTVFGPLTRVSNVVSNSVSTALVTTRSRLIKAPTNPTAISNLELWLDADDVAGLYTTDSGATEDIAEPTAITGCAAWWDASDTSTVLLSGSNVTQWNDKSGNGRNLTAAGSAQPTYSAYHYSKRVITFNGTSNSLSLENSNLIQNRAGYTVFCVVKPSNTTTGERFHFAAAAAAGGQVRARVGTTAAAPLVGGRRVDADSLAQLTGVANTVSSTMTGAHVICGVFNHGSNDLTAVLNGMVFGTDTGYQAVGVSADVTSLITVGSQNTYGYYAGDMCEVVVYATALSASDRARVEKYLAAKWSVLNTHVQALDHNQPVGYWRDKSGNNRHVRQTIAANRPTLAYTYEKPVLTFNGANATPALVASTAADWTFMHNGSPYTIFVVGRWTGGSTVGSFMATGTTGTSTGFDTLIGSSTPYFRHGIMNNSSGPNVVDNALGVPPVNQWAVFRIASHVNGAINRAARSDIYFSGVGAAKNNTQVGAPATSAPSHPLWIGARPGPNVSLQGNIAEVLIFSKLLSAAETTAVEKYLSNKWAVLMAPVVANADAQDWVRRVYVAGGTVSQNVANAVNTFCTDIETAGLRSKFARLNLVCGDNLNAALVPLYRNWKIYTGKNLISSSETFTTGWTASAASLTVTTIAPPFGAAAVRAIVEDATLAQHMIYLGVNAGDSPSSPYTASCYFKAGTRTAAFIQLLDANSANNVYAYFNLVTGEATHTQYGGGSAVVTTSMTAVGAGWYRCRVSLSGSGLLNSNQGFSIGTADYSLSGSSRHGLTGNGAATTLYLWGAQLESGGTLTDYDPTPYGNATETNGNFTAAGYQETGGAGGLLGVVNNTYLSTGVAQNTVSVTNRHLSVYEATPIPTNSYATLISSADATQTGAWFIAYNLPPINVRYSGLGSSSSYAQDLAVSSSDAFWLGSNNATQSALYKNGIAAATATNASQLQVSNSAVIVVYGSGAGTNSQNPNSRLRGYSIGAHLTAAESQTYNTIMQRFQRAIGRTTANYTGFHAEAVNWYQRVLDAGGAANENTLRAVSDFCAAIDAGGLRDKIYRLNLFAGANLNAATVPLYLGPVANGATKNLIGLNENFSRWILNNGTVTQNAIAAPNGTVTADLFVENNTAANNYGVRQNVDLAASTTYTLSCYIKKKDLRYVQLNLYVGQNTGAYFDLDTGAVANTFGPVTSPTITAAGNGWWRCSITATNTTATNDRPMYILPTTQSNDSGHVGVVGAGTYFWGAQLEVGALTNYAPRVHGNLLDANTGYAETDYTPTGGFNANTTTGTKHLVLCNKPLRDLLSDLSFVHMATTVAASATWTGNRRTLATFQNVNGTGGSYGFSVAASGQVTGTVSNGVSFTTMAFDNVFRNYVISRTSNTSVRGYVNGVYGAQSTTNTTTYLNTKTRLASGTSFYDTTDGTGVESSPYESWPGRIADYSVGLGLDDTQAAALAAAFQAFRTAIGRV